MNMRITGAVGRRVVGGVAALATVASTLVAAVAIAPAAQATGGVTRIQVLELAEGLPGSGTSDLDVSSPSSGTTYKKFANARKSSLPLTVTFTGGTASFTVNGGSATPLTSDVAVRVPIDTGLTAIAITFNDGNADTTYNVEIKRPWLITGLELWDSATNELLLRRHVDDGNFDPLSSDTVSLSVPHDVARIKWTMFYEDPANVPLGERSTWFHNAPYCDGDRCESGELSQNWSVPVGTWTGGGPLTQVTTGTGYDYFSFTYWPVSITRAAAYSSSQLSSVTAPGITFEAVSGTPYTFRGLVPASRSTLPVTATFESGSATYSVDGGPAAAVTSGSAFTVPVSVGGTTLTITHTGTEGDTTYTYRLVRPMAITGLEVADATTGDILYTKTGADFDPTFAEYAGWSSGLQKHTLNVPNSVASVKMRMFYDTPPGDYVGRWWFHNWTECDGECESGEWSRPVNLSVGSRGGGGPLSMCNISSTCTYGDWTYWSLEITRASETVSIGSVSVSGSAAVDQALTATANTVTAVPTATLAYKWQYADSAAGPWNDIPGATARKYVVRRAMVGKVLRAEVTGTNGVSTPGTTASSATSAVTSIALAAPTAISAVAGDGSLLVSWTPPNDPDYTGGTATATAGSSTETCTGTTSCLITGLTNGETYTVTVVARAGTGAGEVTSPASSSITATPAVPTAPAMTDVTVSGTVTEGQRLTAVPGGLTGSPTPTLTYLWERSANGTDGWTAIPGGTRSTLRLGNSVAGTYIRVTATASTGVNPTVTRTSAAAGPVTSATEVLPDAELTITVPGAPSGQARDVAFDSQGYMYVVTGWSSGADAIMKFAPGATGSDAPLVVWQRGDDGSSLWGSGITVDANDNVWMADHNYRLWKLPAGAGPTDRPQLVAENPTIDRGWDIITDADGYIYFSEIGTNRVKVFAPDVELGDSPVRTIDVGGQAGSVAIAEDGSLIVGSSNTLKFFTPGPSGSNTPIRTLTPSDGCQHFYGIAVDADGRIYNSSSNCRKVYVWNPNAVALVTPIKVLDLENDYGLMGRNPVTGNVYVAGIDRRSVVTWDRAALGMGPIPVVEAPRMGTVTTSVTGEVAVRGTLTGAYSGLTGLPAPTLASSWQIADSASGPWTLIGGQTGTTLDIASAYEGKYLRYSVTVSNSEGENTTSSTPVGPVAPRPARGIVRWIVGSNMQTETITDIEFLPGDRIATANQWANDDRIQVFGPTADGNASPVQSIRFAFAGGRQSGWGINVAPDGDIWGAYHGGWAVKVPTDADGSTTPTRALTGEAERVNPSVLDGARSLVEDDNGYLYVGLHDSSRIRVFAPGASNTDAPIREISVWNRGLGIDIDGNLVVASNGYLRVYEPGASTNDSPIQEVSLGGNGWDLAIDGEQRIWVLVGDRILVFNPHLANTSVPAYTISDDWATRTAGAAAIGVSKETDGLFAVATSDSIRTYDYSTLLPAVPGESAPAIASVNVTGTVAFGEQLTAAATGVTGYPDSQLTYQWQRAEDSAGPWTDITAATGATYTPIALDELHYLRAKVTATNSVDAVSVASSATTRLGYASAGTPVSYLANVVYPWAMHLLPSGNLLVANRNYDVREFAAGAAFSDAPIRVITAAGYSGPAGVFQDSAGYLWINYEGQGRVVKLAGNAGRNATPLQVFNPGCSIHAKVVVDEDGYIYVPCWHEGMVRVFAPDATGDATPLRTLTGTSNARAELDPDGTLTVVGNNYVRTYALGGADASTEPLTNKAAPFHLMDVTWDGKGNILLAGWSGGFRAYPLTSASYDGEGYVMNGLQMIREAWSTVYDTTNDELYVGSYHGFVTKYDWDSVLEGDAVAPSRPSEFEVTTEDGEITATWTAPVETYTAVEVYADAGSGTLTCRVTAPTSTCTLTAADGVALDRQYRVWARAYNEGSASPDTDSIYVTPEIIVAPDPVTNLQATAGSRTFTVTWTASPGEVTEYEVTATGGTDPLVCTTTETQCVFDTGVVNGVTYSVTVRTIRRTESATSSPVTVTPQPSPGELPPGRVSGVAAEGLNGEITVTWSKPTGTITGYVATAQRTGETLTCQTDSADALECVIEGATNTATYSVTVVAFNVDQGSPVSNPVSVTVIRREAPSVSPFTLTGTPQSGRTLRATGLTIGGFPEPEVTYRWESSASLEGPWIPVEAGEEPSYDLGKVDVGRFIRLVVVAANGVGDNARRTSDLVGPVLNMAGGTESVARPITTFRATAGDARITLSWDEVKGVTADTYTVRIEGGGAVREVSVRGTLTRTVVTGVRNGTTYTVSVTATGHPTSKTRDLVVIPAGKLGPVREVRSVVAGTTVTVSWKRPQGTSPVGLYRVVLDAIKPSVRDREFTAKTTQVVARNLISGEQYRLRIVAINRVGSGQAYAAPRPVTIR